MYSRLTYQKKQEKISVRLYDLCISLFMDILRMIFTFSTPIIMKSCADPVSHNVSKCRLGNFLFCITVCCGITENQEN